MKKAFTLIEMLVVVAIIAALVAATVGGYSAVTRTAEQAKCRELVSNVATALSALYQQEGSWPKRLTVAGEMGGKLDERAIPALKKYFSLTLDSSGKPTGFDRFGIVTPWAVAAIKRSGTAASASTAVSQGAHGEMTIADHILHYAVDVDGDGVVSGVNVGGEGIKVRASAVVWCGGKDGFVEPYTKGLKADDIYSWTPGQTRAVK